MLNLRDEKLWSRVVLISYKFLTQTLYSTRVHFYTSISVSFDNTSACA